MPPYAYRPDRRALVRFIAAPFVVCGVLAGPALLKLWLDPQNAGAWTFITLMSVSVAFPMMIVVGWPLAFWLLRTGQDGYGVFAGMGAAGGVLGVMAVAIIASFIGVLTGSPLGGEEGFTILVASAAGIMGGPFAMAFRLVSGRWTLPALGRRADEMFR